MNESIASLANTPIAKKILWETCGVDGEHRYRIVIYDNATAEGLICPKKGEGTYTPVPIIALPELDVTTTTTKKALSKRLKPFRYKVRDNSIQMYTKSFLGTERSVDKLIENINNETFEKAIKLMDHFTKIRQHNLIFKGEILYELVGTHCGRIDSKYKSWKRNPLGWLGHISSLSMRLVNIRLIEDLLKKFSNEFEKKLSSLERISFTFADLRNCFEPILGFEPIGEVLIAMNHLAKRGIKLPEIEKTLQGMYEKLSRMLETSLTINDVQKISQEMDLYPVKDQKMHQIVFTRLLIIVMEQHKVELLDDNPAKLVNVYALLGQLTSLHDKRQLTAEPIVKDSSDGPIEIIRAVIAKVSTESALDKLLKGYQAYYKLWPEEGSSDLEKDREMMNKMIEVLQVNVDKALWCQHRGVNYLYAFLALLQTMFPLNAKDLAAIKEQQYAKIVAACHEDCDSSFQRLKEVKPVSQQQTAKDMLAVFEDISMYSGVLMSSYDLLGSLRGPTSAVTSAKNELKASFSQCLHYLVNIEEANIENSLYSTFFVLLKNIQDKSMWVEKITSLLAQGFADKPKNELSELFQLYPLMEKFEISSKMEQSEGAYSIIKKVFLRLFCTGKNSDGSELCKYIQFNQAMEQAYNHLSLSMQEKVNKTYVYLRGKTKTKITDAEEMIKQQKEAKFLEKQQEEAARVLAQQQAEKLKEQAEALQLQKAINAFIKKIDGKLGIKLTEKLKKEFRENDMENISSAFEGDANAFAEFYQQSGHELGLCNVINLKLALARINITGYPWMEPKVLSLAINKFYFRRNSRHIGEHEYVSVDYLESIILDYFREASDKASQQSNARSSSAYYTGHNPSTYFTTSNAMPSEYVQGTASHLQYNDPTSIYSYNNAAVNLFRT